MSEKPQIEEEVPDEGLTRIVSYLDGELDDTQMNEVEVDLINDPDLRSHADILSRTWALLDELDEVSASEQFTKDTLATIAAETVTADDAPADSRVRLRHFWSRLAQYKVLPCFLAGLIGGTAGLLVSSKAWEQRQATGEQAVTRIVLDNFELVRRADVYSAVPSLKELEALELPDAAVGGQTAKDGVQP